MAGISHVLNVAKEALLAHQLSVQVAAHNVANVDTPGYTRQTLSLTPNLATPISAGQLGGGVKGEMIERQYDQFMTQRIMTQKSLLGNLEAQQESLRVVETVFNEAPGLALNDLMNQFWSSWQDLADNPEILATRQTVVQNGQLLFDHLQGMNAEIVRAKNDIGVNLDTAVKDVNSLSQQIADINVEISTSEGPNRKANDLRDKRDQLVKDLSQLLDVTYFENKIGSYTVLLADGHPLVDSADNWQVDWADNKLYWLNSNPDGAVTRQALGGDSSLGGKIGGWLEIRGQLTEGNPDNYLGRLNALANALIREVNQQHSQGVGMIRFESDLTGTATASNTARLTTPVEAATATMTIPSGTIRINDREVGEIDGAAAANGLAMQKAANAVKAINDAVTGVDARLTTLVAGSAVTPMAASPANDGDVISFDLNNITVTYTVDNDGVGTDDSDPAVFAGNLANAINAAISTYNAAATNAPKMSLEAIVGDGYNGGALNSIVLRNTNPGDQSRITIANIASTPTGIESNLGLTAGTYTADATHNTGKITLFSDAPFTVKAGTDDTYLNQLGMGGGNQATTTFTGNPVTAAPVGPNTDIDFNLNGVAVNVNVAGGTAASAVATAAAAAINNPAVQSLTGVTATVNASNALVFTNLTTGDNSPIIVDGYTVNAGGDILGFNNFTAEAGGVAGDSPNDGQFTYSYTNGGVAAPLMGYEYANELQTDGGSFDIWLYNTDGTLALPQAVTVNLERAYTLQDVADAINVSITNATGLSTPWVSASIDQNRLKLSPDGNHKFAFANDTSNFLQVAGINTFFTGHSAGTMGLNDVITKDLNLIAAGTVSQHGDIYRGDNSNALLITNIQQKEDVSFTGGTTNSLDGFYNALVGEIGNQGRTVDRNTEFNNLVLNQMNDLRDSTSGVSLDEEMANLIKFQHAYAAASRLISMSDEMLKSLLDAVR